MADPRYCPVCFRVLESVPDQRPGWACPVCGLTEPVRHGPAAPADEPTVVDREGT